MNNGEVTTVVENKLKRLRKKQKLLLDAWRKTGNRSLMEFFVDIIPRMLDAERCSIFILDPKQANAWVHCGSSLEERQVSVPLDDSFVGQVISSGKTLAKYDIHITEGVHEMVDYSTGFTTRNILCIPIWNVAGNLVVGALQVLNKKGENPFSQEDIELLKRFAAQTQMNIEHVFLKQEIGRLSEAISEKIKQLEGVLLKRSIEAAIRTNHSTA
jgi:GAF domain-containing protein